MRKRWKNLKVYNSQNTIMGRNYTGAEFLSSRGQETLYLGDRLIRHGETEEK